MKKTMKKIVSIGVATAVAATSLTGVMAAADLGSYPAPFVKDGIADFAIVIGENAATSDVIGAIDIATNLQASAVTEEAVAIAGVTSSTVEGGYTLGGELGEDDYLTLNEAITTATEKVDFQDLPVLLADGELSDEDGDNQDNDDVDYDQELTFNGFSVSYGTPEQRDDGILYLNTEDGTSDDWTLTVDFDQLVSMSGYDDSETIEIAGKTFTIGTETTNSSLQLFGSDATTFVNLNEPVTIEQDGKTYEVEIVGGNDQADSGNGNVIVSVNGVRETLEEGDNEKVNGLDLYVQDLFVTNIPTLSASANLFVGANEVILTNGEIELNGDDLEGYTYATQAGDDGFDVLDTLAISFDFAGLDSENGFDEDEDTFLEVGEEFVDPLFGTFKLVFQGPTVAAMDDSKGKFFVERSGKALDLTFTNDDGEELEVEIADNDLQAEDLILIAGDVDKNNYFFGNDVDVTSVFEITDIDYNTPKADNRITIKNLGSGAEKEYKHGETVEDAAGITVDLDTDGAQAKLVGLPANTTAAAAIQYKIQGGSNFTIDATDFSALVFAITEDVDSSEETGSTDVTFAVTATWDSGSDKEYDVTSTNTTGNVFEFLDDSDDMTRGYTAFGTYYVSDTDDQMSFESYFPDEDEVGYAVFLAPAESSVTVSGGSSSVTSTKLNPIGVGATLLDSDVTLATATKNLIVVGGPAINSVASELLGNPADPSTVMSPGTAIIELFDNVDTGSVAMLVAGYSAIDTQEASRLVATQSSDVFVSGSTSASVTVTGLRSSSVSTN